MIAVCTLCGGNSVHKSFMHSLIAELNDPPECGLTFVSSPGSSGAGRGRDKLAAIALAMPEVTHILWIDADESWRTGLAKRLLSHNKDIVGAAYPKKTEDTQWTHSVKEGGRREGDLLECDGVGTGALLVRREVYEKIAANMPDLHITEGTNYLAPTEEMRERLRYYFCGYHLDAIFDGRVMSDDYSFCWRARQMGFDCWVDLDWPVVHYGEKAYKESAKEFFDVPE